jgi:3-hydroxybutyryl-CoA dehydrogenase
MTEKLSDYALSKDVQKKDAIVKLGVVGCGAMGQEIAIHASKKGLEVVFIDIDEEIVRSAILSIEKQLDLMINSWGMTGGEKKAVLSRIKGFVGYEHLEECTIVIEAINTRKPVSNIVDRQEVMKQIEAVVSDTAIIASNASTVVIADLASVLKYPNRAVGIHFISPVESVKIIEVNQSVNTCDGTMLMVQKFAKMIGKQIIMVNGSPGNISTRLIVPLINEACELLMEGVGTIEDIDNTLMFGFGLQLGPFQMADKIGLDKLVKWMEGLYDEYGEKRFKASPVLKKLVRANMLGKITGEGFYSYKNDERISKNTSILNIIGSC